jgi:hypothetical protein
MLTIEPMGRLLLAEYVSDNRAALLATAGTKTRPKSIIIANKGLIYRREPCPDKIPP